jgi:hypothetical protein
MIGILQLIVSMFELRAVIISLDLILFLELILHSLSTPLISNLPDQQTSSHLSLAAIL